MNGEKYNSKRAPQAVGLYPHARKVGNLLFLSGVGPRVVNEQKIPGVELNKERRKLFRKKYKLNDIWGDFHIIFASSFIREKVIDLPVRYYERVQGVSKMGKRFFNFLNMLKVCLKVFKCFKLKNKLI